MSGVNFQIDYGSLKVPAAAPLARGEGPLYAAVDGRIAGLGGDEAVFYDPATDRSHVMTQQVLQALDLCREFQPLDVHVEAIAAALPGLKGQQAGVRRVLEGLASRGLLQTEDALLTRMQQSAAVSPAPVGGLFIRACDRPAQLEALLDSLADHAARHPLPGPLIVVDDSRDPAAVARHADLAQQFATRTGATVECIDADRWQRLLDALYAALPEHADALQALLRTARAGHGIDGGGRGKNLITLLSAGTRYVLLDDDFLFPLKRHPAARDGIAFDDRALDPRVYPTLDAALAEGAPVDDALSTHLQLCGMPIAAVDAALGAVAFKPGSLRGMAPSRLPALDPRARIRLTAHGHRGNTGSAAPGWLFLLGGRGAGPMLESAAAFDALAIDPPVWFGVAQPMLSTGGSLTPFAVDNATLTPCTSPFGRGEDALFAALLRLADGQATQLDLPLAIGHRQEGVRNRSDTLRTAHVPPLNQCLTELAQHTAGDAFGATADARLGLLAAKLDDLAAADDAAVVAYLREYLAYRRSAWVQTLQVALARAEGAPEHWLAALRANIEVNGRALVERGVPRFAGWPEHWTAADCAAAFRREARTLAAGLRAWPAAWQWAREHATDWLRANRA